MPTLKLLDQSYDVPAPTQEQLDLGRARSVAGMLFQIGMEADKLPQKLAQADPDNIEAVLDAHYDNEVAAERLTSDLFRRLSKFFVAVGKLEIVDILKAAEPSDRALLLLELFTQLFQQTAGDPALLKN